MALGVEWLGQSVVIDSNGDVFAGGDLGGLAVVKLSGSTGGEMWRQVATGGGFAQALKLTGDFFKAK